MPRKKAPQRKSPRKDERTQRERFEQFAREYGATEEVLDKAMAEIAKAKPKKG